MSAQRSVSKMKKEWRDSKTDDVDGGLKIGKDIDWPVKSAKVKRKVHALSSTQLSKRKVSENHLRVEIFLLCSLHQECGHQSVMGVLNATQHQRDRDKKGSHLRNETSNHHPTSV